MKNEKGFYAKIDLDRFLDVVLAMPTLYFVCKKQYGYVGISASDDAGEIISCCRFSVDTEGIAQGFTGGRILNNNEAKRRLSEGYLDGNSIEVFIVNKKKDFSLKHFGMNSKVKEEYRKDK